MKRYGTYDTHDTHGPHRTRPIADRFMCVRVCVVLVQLKDVVILDPQWLMDVMSTVISTKHNFCRCATRPLLPTHTQHTAHGTHGTRHTERMCATVADAGVVVVQGWHFVASGAAPDLEAAVVPVEHAPLHPLPSRALRDLLPRQRQRPQARYARHTRTHAHHTHTHTPHTTRTTRTTHALIATPVGNYASVLRPASAGEELYLIPSMLPEVKPAQLQDLWPAKKGTFQFPFPFQL